MKIARLCKKCPNTDIPRALALFTSDIDHARLAISHRKSMRSNSLHGEQCDYNLRL
jgi:hypothetical protein